MEVKRQNWFDAELLIVFIPAVIFLLVGAAAFLASSTVPAGPANEVELPTVPARSFVVPVEQRHDKTT